MSRVVSIHLLVIGCLPCIRSSVFTDVEAWVRTAFCFEPDNKCPLCMRHFSLIHVSVPGSELFLPVAFVDQASVDAGMQTPLWDLLPGLGLELELLGHAILLCLLIEGTSFCFHSTSITSHPSNSAQGFQLLLVLSTHCSLGFNVYTRECEVAHCWVLRILCVFHTLLFLYQISAFIFYSNL